MQRAWGPGPVVISLVKEGRKERGREGGARGFLHPPSPYFLLSPLSGRRGRVRGRVQRLFCFSGGGLVNRASWQWRHVRHLGARWD